MVRPHCHGPQGKFLGDLKKINESWKIWMEHTNLLCGGKGTPVSPLASTTILFLGSTGWVVQTLECAGAGKRVLISVNPFLSVPYAFTCVFFQEGGEPTSFYVAYAIHKGNSAQVRQPVSMGKLREVGGFQGRSPKLRHSLVMEILTSLRFRESP